MQPIDKEVYYGMEDRSYLDIDPVVSIQIISGEDYRDNPVADFML